VVTLVGRAAASDDDGISCAPLVPCCG
jgi:hypothetical protein